MIILAVNLVEIIVHIFKVELSEECIENFEVMIYE